MRRKARIDANQPELVKLIRSHRASFQHTHTVPGALDGIVGWCGVDQRVEIKDPSRPPSARKLTPAEKEVFDEWQGRPPVVIETPEDVLKLLRQMQNDSLR